MDDEVSPVSSRVSQTRARGRIVDQPKTTMQSSHEVESFSVSEGRLRLTDITVSTSPSGKEFDLTPAHAYHLSLSSIHPPDSAEYQRLYLTAISPLSVNHGTSPVLDLAEQLFSANQELLAKDALTKQLLEKNEALANTLALTESRIELIEKELNFSGTTSSPEDGSNGPSQTNTISMGPLEPALQVSDKEVQTTACETDNGTENRRLGKQVEYRYVDDISQLTVDNAIEKAQLNEKIVILRQLVEQHVEEKEKMVSSHTKYVENIIQESQKDSKEQRDHYEKLITNLRAETEMHVNEIQDLEQQLAAADAQLRNHRAFFDQQALEKDQETQDSLTYLQQLQIQLQERDKEKGEAQRLAKEVETLEQQLSQRLQDHYREQGIHDKLRRELELASEESSHLREVIQSLEQDLEANTLTSERLENEVVALQKALEEKEKLQLELYEELEMLRSAVTDRSTPDGATHSEEEHGKGANGQKDYSTEFDIPNLFEEMKVFTHNLLLQADNRIKELEALQNQGGRGSESPLITEDISLKDRIRFDDDGSLENVRDLSPSPAHTPFGLQPLHRLSDRLQALWRCEEAACKKARDLEYQLERSSQENRSQEEAWQIKLKRVQSQLEDTESEREILKAELAKKTKLVSALEAKIGELRGVGGGGLQALQDAKLRAEECALRLEACCEQLELKDQVILGLKHDLESVTPTLQNYQREFAQNQLEKSVLQAALDNAQKSNVLQELNQIKDLAQQREEKLQQLESELNHFKNRVTELEAQARVEDTLASIEKLRRIPERSAEDLTASFLLQPPKVLLNHTLVQSPVLEEVFQNEAAPSSFKENVPAFQEIGNQSLTLEVQKRTRAEKLLEEKTTLLEAIELDLHSVAQQCSQLEKALLSAESKHEEEQQQFAQSQYDWNEINNALRRELDQRVKLMENMQQDMRQMREENEKLREDNVQRMDTLERELRERDMISNSLRVRLSRIGVEHEQRLAQLNEEAKNWEEKQSRSEQQIRSLEHELKERNEIVANLQRELATHKDVTMTTCTPSIPSVSRRESPVNAMLLDKFQTEGLHVLRLSEQVYLRDRQRRILDVFSNSSTSPVPLTPSPLPSPSRLETEASEESVVRQAELCAKIARLEQELKTTHVLLFDQEQLNREKHTHILQLLEEAAQERLAKLRLQREHGGAPTPVPTPTPPNVRETKQLEKLQVLHGHYLKAESCRKNLVVQKQYLLTVLQAYKEKYEAGAKPKKVKLTFRTAVLVVLAIQRAKFILKRWQVRKRVSSAMLSGRSLVANPSPRASYSATPPPTSARLSTPTFTPPTRDRERSRPSPSSSSRRRAVHKLESAPDETALEYSAV